MSQQAEPLKAQPREGTGKGAARALRRNSMVPAVIYGDKKDPVKIALPYKEIAMRIYGGGFWTTLAQIDLDGEIHQVLPRDFQADPVRDFIQHVDFLRVTEKSRVVVNIPVHVLGEEDSPGMERGGVLNLVRHEVELECPATAIPDFIEISVAGLDIGDAVHISAVKLPENVKPTITDRDFTIATIAGSAAMLPEDEELEDEDAEEIEGEEGEGAEGEDESEGEEGGEE